MTRCAVLHCKSENSKQKDDVEKIRFHKFPRNIELLMQWLAKCKLRAGLNLKKAVLCSLHFRQDDYRYRTKCKMIDFTAPPSQLKPDAVPSTNLFDGHLHKSIHFQEDKFTSSTDDEESNNELDDGRVRIS